MRDIAEMVLLVYLGMGVFTVVLALIAIYLGEKLTLTIRGKKLRGWRYGVTVILLFLIVLFLWPIVWLTAKRS